MSHQGLLIIKFATWCGFFFYQKIEDSIWWTQKVKDNYLKTVKTLAIFPIALILFLMTSFLAATVERQVLFIYCVKIFSKSECRRCIVILYLISVQICFSSS